MTGFQVNSNATTGFITLKYYRILFSKGIPMSEQAKAGDQDIRYQRTWAEIDLQAIRHNARILKDLAGPKRLFMACVKGNGYGHGMVPVAEAALEGGADRLSVAYVEEGVELRKAGVSAPIQLLIEPDVEEAPILYRYNLIPSLSSPDIARGIAAKLPGKTKIHVEVDTGMKRVPLSAEGAQDFLHLLDSLGKFEIEGLFSHFNSSHISNDEGARRFTLNQLNAFLDTVKNIETGGRSIPIKHMASSGAVALYPEAYLDMIRPGALLYGFNFDWADLPLKPALTWKTRVKSVLHAKKGIGVGYDQTYVPTKDTTLAVLSIGYANGYSRMLSNRSHVLLRGKRARVVGLVGMNETIADVDKISGVSTGDEVILIGEDRAKRVSAVELADLFGTTPVIFTCGISERVRRVYLNQCLKKTSENSPLS